MFRNNNNNQCVLGLLEVGLTLCNFFVYDPSFIQFYNRYLFEVQRSSCYVVETVGADSTSSLMNEVTCAMVVL